MILGGSDKLINCPSSDTLSGDGVCEWGCKQSLFDWYSGVVVHHHGRVSTVGMEIPVR